MTTAPLSRDRLEKALSTLQWTNVEPVLAQSGGQALDVGQVAKVVLRTNSLVLKYPSPAAESNRQAMFEALHRYFAGVDLQQLDEAIATLQVAESGYRTIVNALSQTDAGRLPAEEQTAAAIALCEREVKKMAEKLGAQSAERQAITPHLSLREEDGKLVSPDAILEQLVNIPGMTLNMHAHAHKWFDSDGVIVAPLQENVTEEAVYKVGATGMLAILWRRWQNTEERARFIGRTLRQLPQENWPDDAPADLQRLVHHVAEPDIELFHQVAFERMRDWLGQNFFEMMSDRSVEHLEVGDNPGPHLLPPAAIVSRNELHAATALSSILSYDITKDMERPGGVRLLEWVRGYAALANLDDSTLVGQRIAKTRADWVKFFIYWGLAAQAAERLVDGITFRRGSRDLFDHPLIKQATGEYLLFRPAFHSMNIAQVVFSTLGQLRAPLQKKGDSFEKAVLALFRANGLKAYSFKEKRAGETYQIDALVPWGDYLFLFECKNRALPQLNPMQMAYFDEETLENLAQIQRLMEGLKAHPDILAKHLPAQDSGKPIIPCVLNALPYSIPGGLDSVYFYDFSALGRFFKSGAIMARSFTRADGFLNATPWLRIWAGDKATADDLLAQMKQPVQFTAVRETLDFVPQGFPLPEKWFVMTHDFTRKEHPAMEKLIATVSGEKTASSSG